MILHEGWLDYCMLFFCYINEKDYLLTSEQPKVDVSKLSQTFVFDENRRNIEEFYAVGDDEMKSFYETINTDIK